MLIHINELKADLQALKEKYKITIMENDQYDGQDRYIGTDQYFRLKNEVFYVQTVEQIMEEVFGTNYSTRRNT